MSQVATKKKLALRDERVRVTAFFREQGSVLQGSVEGTCEGFDIELSIESDDPAEEIAELICLSHRMCFTESALTGNIPLTNRHSLNGQPIEVETDHS